MRHHGRLWNVSCCELHYRLKAPAVGLKKTFRQIRANDHSVASTLAFFSLTYKFPQIFFTIVSIPTWQSLQARPPLRPWTALGYTQPWKFIVLIGTLRAIVDVSQPVINSVSRNDSGNDWPRNDSVLTLVPGAIKTPDSSQHARDFTG